MTLDGAKQAMANYAGSYILEFNELRNHLDDGCEVLQQGIFVHLSYKAINVIINIIIKF